jgi:hypothetical protein
MICRRCFRENAKDIGFVKVCATTVQQQCYNRVTTVLQQFNSSVTIAGLRGCAWALLCILSENGRLQHMRTAFNEVKLALQM